MKDAQIVELRPWVGVQVPRIHTKLTDLPSRGPELIDFSKSAGIELLPWQEFIAVHGLKYKPDGRWAHPMIGVMAARQQGKSTFMVARILAGMFLWNESNQVGTAHRLSTARQVFEKIVETIESHDHLSKHVAKIRYREGEQEIRLTSGARYMIRAGNNATRGIGVNGAPETIYLDELREHRDLEGFASLKYVLQAAKNPQTMIFSNAGDLHSIILNQLRERALGAIAGTDDPIGWFEWSAPEHENIKDVNGNPNLTALAAANPSLGYTVHPDNLKSVLNDPEEIVRTEVLCQWVSNIAGAIPPASWAENGQPEIELDPEKSTFFAFDVSPNHRSASLIAAQNMGDKFIIKLLETWTRTEAALDDRKVAAGIAEWAHAYPCELITYCNNTGAASVAAQLTPAGLPITPTSFANYTQACDELLSAVQNHRLIHSNQQELTNQIIAAARVNKGDGSWVIGRRASASTVTAAVSTALATHYATRPTSDIDIMII